MNFAEISIFSAEISNFGYVRKHRQKLHFNTFFLILLTFTESLLVILIDIVTILMMSLKSATLGYDVMISVHDVTNKILFGAHSSIAIEVIETVVFFYGEILSI